ncbi:MAG: LytTR family DNA-binding domain-containing protein [Bacteroidia bacterium]
MKRLKVIIADDELPALNLIDSYVKQIPSLQLVARCNNSKEVLDVLSKTDVDLLFLDIQMPGMNGLELSKRLLTDVKVIFTTAFPNYAIEGYKVNAIDYLLKPFDFEEFSLAVKKTNSMINTEIENTSDSIFVKSDHKLINIKFDNILYVESDRDYVKLFTENMVAPVSTLTTLKELELQLPSNFFMRIHRSFIINLKKIDHVERNQVIISNTRITLADSYKDIFHNYLNKHTL